MICFLLSWGSYACTLNMRRKLILLYMEQECEECKEVHDLCETDHTWQTVFRLKDLIKKMKGKL